MKTLLVLKSLSLLLFLSLSAGLGAAESLNSQHTIQAGIQEYIREYNKLCHSSSATTDENTPPPPQEEALSDAQWKEKLNTDLTRETSQDSALDCFHLKANGGNLAAQIAQLDSGRGPIQNLVKNAFSLGREIHEADGWSYSYVVAGLFTDYFDFRQLQNRDAIASLIDLISARFRSQEADPRLAGEHPAITYARTFLTFSLPVVMAWDWGGGRLGLGRNLKKLFLWMKRRGSAPPPPGSLDWAEEASPDADHSRPLQHHAWQLTRVTLGAVPFAIFGIAVDGTPIKEDPRPALEMLRAFPILELEMTAISARVEAESLLRLVSREEGRELDSSKLRARLPEIRARLRADSAAIDRLEVKYQYFASHAGRYVALNQWPDLYPIRKALFSMQSFASPEERVALLISASSDFSKSIEKADAQVKAKARAEGIPPQTLNVRTPAIEEKDLRPAREALQKVREAIGAPS